MDALLVVNQLWFLMGILICIANNNFLATDGSQPLFPRFWSY